MVDDLAFSQNISVSKNEILDVLDLIHDFDPAGVGARNLKECLLIQLKRKDDHDENIENAILIIDRYFNEFTKKHYEKIIKKTGITEK